MTRRDDLRLLSIFHYVLAGLSALGGGFGLIYVVMGFAMMGSSPGNAGSPQPPPPVGWLFVVMGLAFLAAALGFAVLLVLAGRFIARTRHWTYCLVIAGLSCAFFPFGTVLGVFTIVVLSKAEVKALFEPLPTVPVGGGA